MKFLDEYRDGEAARKLSAAIARTVTRPWTIMEVCGGQTHTIVKYGIDRILPPQVELVHGPGCPVCVTSLEMIDRAHAIASRPDIIFCSFGDMLRVPGSRGDLLQLKSKGADVRVVYSPLDAVNLAAANPARKVVFFAIGFETTAPPNAMAVFMARKRKLTNFSALVSHVLVPPMISALLNSPDNRVQGFLGPGHVCTVMGTSEYEPLTQRHHVPIVITGFEPLDLLEGVYRTILQLEEGRAEVENAYGRAVRPEGNPASRKLIDDVFEVCDRKWRGVGLVPASGFRLRDEFRDHDAETLFDVQDIETQESSICISGQVLKGLKKPHDCPAFGKQCTPQNPLGATMVSSEGACAAYHAYGRHLEECRSGLQPVVAAPALRVMIECSSLVPFDGGGSRCSIRLGAARTLGETSEGEDVDAGPNGEASRDACPLPQSRYDQIVLGHGSGGQLTAELIERLFVPGFGNDVLDALEDQATLTLGQSNGLKAPRIAFTTDSFVVKPLFFPGGDIGRLAVHGTVNDLAVGGARPLFLSAAFILEEGLPIADLTRSVASMRLACDEAGVALVTGDTKVVDRGKGDGVFITTSGIGLVPEGRSLSIHAARPGDAILVSGTLGDHGIAIMSVREGLEFETVLESDSAALNGLAEAVLTACPQTRCMRDPTRGGLSSALNELAAASQVGVQLVEAAIPFRPEVRGACEMLGLDPLYVANEGKLIAVVPPDQADAVLVAMQNHPLGRNAAIVGEVVADHPGMVILRSRVGGERVVTLLAGEQLPRIC